MNLPYCIEPASLDRQESLIDLLCEVHAYYNAGAHIPRELVREHLLENLLSASSPHRLVLAIAPAGDVVGLAAITPVFFFAEAAPDKRKHLQLKELYVSASHRSQGIGQAIMAWVARHALQNDCHRIDWRVRESNAKGILFYEQLGAHHVKERLHYRIADSSLTALASGDETQTSSRPA